MLGLSKVSARWVPRMLKSRLDISKYLLSLYEDDPSEEFMHRVVFKDKTWVHHFDPEAKKTEHAVEAFPAHPFLKQI